MNSKTLILHAAIFSSATAVFASKGPVILDVVTAASLAAVAIVDIHAYRRQTREATT
jgi:hypothetical protein